MIFFHLIVHYIIKYRPKYRDLANAFLLNISLYLAYIFPSIFYHLMLPNLFNSLKTIYGIFKFIFLIIPFLCIKYFFLL